MAVVFPPILPVVPVVLAIHGAWWPLVVLTACFAVYGLSFRSRIKCIVVEYCINSQKNRGAELVPGCYGYPSSVLLVSIVGHNRLFHKAFTSHLKLAYCHTSTALNTVRRCKLGGYHSTPLLPHLPSRPSAAEVHS